MNDNERLFFQKALDLEGPIPPLSDDFALRMAERVAAERKRRERRSELITAIVSITAVLLTSAAVCIAVQMLGVIDFGGLAKLGLHAVESVDMRSVIPHADPSAPHMLPILMPAIVLSLLLMLGRELRLRKDARQ